MSLFTKLPVLQQNPLQNHLGNWPVVFLLSGNQLDTHRSHSDAYARSYVMVVCLVINACTNTDCD